MFSIQKSSVTGVPIGVSPKSTLPVPSAISSPEVAVTSISDSGVKTSPLMAKSNGSSSASFVPNDSAPL